MIIVENFINKCHNNLINNQCEEYKNAYNYLSSRGLKKQSLIEHKIGYCAYKENLPPQVNHFGHDLSKVDIKDRGYSYFIRGRIIIPIYSEFNKIVGLSTRKPLCGKENTWWNLPKPFYKSHHLFLLDKSRKYIFDNNKAYIVEGYMDALILYQEGIKNVCAIMGTDLSMRKIGLLVRYCNNLCFCLDNDSNNAGENAKNRAINKIQELGFCNQVSVIDGIPIGIDPDEYIIKYGYEKFLSQERILTSEEINSICQKVKEENKN